MLGEERGGKAADAPIRLALRRWVFNTKQREQVPGDVAGYFPLSKLRTGLPNGNGLPPTDTIAVPR